MEETMTTAQRITTRRVREFKRDMPSLRDSEVVMAMAGLGWPSDLVGDALNALADEAGQ